MRQSLSIFITLLFIFGLSGCRSKDELELYRPGDTKVWRTVETADLREYQASLPRVELVTSKGRFVVELYEEQAPVSVANFLEYVNEGFYDGTIFHRVDTAQGVVQGGGFEPGMVRKETDDPIINEADNGLRNLRGTLGVARTSDMNSGTSQFYINLVDNPGFNGDGVTGGYAVFGRVYEGMEVVDAIALVETGSDTVPEESVVIESARQIQ
jgi:cyclophilin family peptidyl-prolyl cis-trans isomerase